MRYENICVDWDFLQIRIIIACHRIFHKHGYTIKSYALNSNTRIAQIKAVFWKSIYICFIQTKIVIACNKYFVFVW
ncbi:hypothetical protein SDC9_105219 [bioreactor metagenome]|uniref:Uncharacterized protein n=1 Tax=bioreactor metagenome TaxID=1076179 RepID=A0A645B017_9ZZZZ